MDIPTAHLALAGGAAWLALLVSCCQAAGEAKVTEGADGVRLATHERRTFALAYEADMAHFAAEDQADPRQGGIVFTGSSSIVGWTTLTRDLAPLPVVNRGFGGSTSPQLWWYAERAVLARQPRVVVVYVGDNDLAQTEVTVGNYLKYVRLLCDKVWAPSPQTRLIFLSNKPSPSRWSAWGKFQEANRRLARMCSRDPRLTYVDLTPTLLDAKGQVRPECFLPDQLHMKPGMYAEWAKVVRPVLQRVWEETVQARARP
jgi:lysophospholipase L1-like esterase